MIPALADDHVLVQKADRIIPWQNTDGPVPKQEDLLPVQEKGLRAGKALCQDCSLRATALARMGGTLHKIPVSQAAVPPRLRLLKSRCPKAGDGFSRPPTPPAPKRREHSRVTTAPATPYFASLAIPVHSSGTHRAACNACAHVFPRPPQLDTNVGALRDSGQS